MTCQNLSNPATFEDDDDFIMIEKLEEGRFLEDISANVDTLHRELREVSLEIHDHPELQYKEFHAHEVLTAYLEAKPGWTVTRSAYGIETAFVAVFDTGLGPTVSFNAEYDALKGIGHACGHNLIAVASVAGALATAMVMEKHGITGRIMLFGTPAEEGGGGKIRLLNAGAYKDVDISLISHPGINPDSALMRTNAYSSFKVDYHGKEAHAAAAPWQGVNALDALITAYNAISVLRQQTEPGDIIQGHITDGGSRPNIIHAYSAGVFVVRAPSAKRLAPLKERVIKCFEAGATATGARLTFTEKGSYLDHTPNKALAARFRRAFNALGGSIPGEDMDWINGTIAASTDQGNISYALPSISPNFWIRSEDNEGKQLGGPHTPEFEQAARTEEAHGLALRVGKALSAAAIDVLTLPGVLKEIQDEFAELQRQNS